MSEEKLSEEFQTIKDKLIEDFKNIYDPEIPVNIYDLGFIYDIRFEKQGNNTYCEVDMTLTSPTCSMADTLVDQVTYTVKTANGVHESKVNVVFDPPWTPELLSEDAKEIMSASGAAMFF